MKSGGISHKYDIINLFFLSDKSCLNGWWTVQIENEN